MTKKILLSSIVTAFIFSGCLGFGDAQPNVDKVSKVKDKVEAKAEKATNVVKDTAKKAKMETKTDSLPTPPESLLKDKVIETVVEIGDDKTDATAPKVIESVE